MLTIGIPLGKLEGQISRAKLVCSRTWCFDVQVCVPYQMDVDVKPQFKVEALPSFQLGFLVKLYTIYILHGNSGFTHDTDTGGLMIHVISGPCVDFLKVVF